MIIGMTLGTPPTFRRALGVSVALVVAAVFAVLRPEAFPPSIHFPRQLPRLQARKALPKGTKT